MVTTDSSKINWSKGIDDEGPADSEPGQEAADRRRAGHAEPGRRDELAAAELQPGDRAVLRARRAGATASGTSTIRAKTRRAGAAPIAAAIRVDAEGDRLQDRQGALERTSGKAGARSGLLSTAGNVVFTGGTPNNLVALNATTGDALWHARLNTAISNGPITYTLDGQQYVVVGAGDTLWAFVLNPPPARR